MNTVKLMWQKLNISYHKVSVSQPVYDFKGGKNQKNSGGKLVICHKADFFNSFLLGYLKELNRNVKTRPKRCAL